MTSADHTHRDETDHSARERAEHESIDWTRLGRAAEEFARHIARDAARFAGRVEEHARDLARDVGREWRRAERRHRHHERGREWEGDSDEMRRVFADVRSFVGDVLDGVDELIGRVFQGAPPEPPASPEPSVTPEKPDTPQTPDMQGWTRVVANRAAECSNCEAAIAAGSEVFVRLTGGEPEFLCAACGLVDPAYR